MEEFLRSYGLWILLALVFFAMHRFGGGCGGGHRHESRPDDEQARPGEEKKPVAHSRHAGGCH